MKIAMIGVGHVGGVLGPRWARNGHEVVFGARDPGGERVQKALAAAEGEARAASAPEAVAGAEVVALATPWDATEAIVKALGDLSGKILIDCTNPLAGRAGLVVGRDNSAAELVAQWAPGAKVVKAFNTTGSKNMASPSYPAGAVSMFICGDDAAAKKTVAGLAEELGFEVVDTGPLMTARYLEPLAALWVHLAYVEGYGPDFAFKVIRR